MTFRTPLSIAFSTLTMFLPGCATMPGKVTVEQVAIAQMVPTEVPMPVKTIEVWDSQTSSRKEVDVLSMKSSEIRSRLTTTETLIAIEKRDQSGSITYLGSTSKVAKGTYRVTFDFANYTNESISFPGAERTNAVGRIGVGLRITADLTTHENGVDLSGLLPIGLAAQDRKVDGQLSFRAYGISNNKLALAVPSNSILDVSAIQKSFEAAAAVRILFGEDDSRLEPYLIGVANVTPYNAKTALNAATEKLTK